MEENNNLNNVEVTEADTTLQEQELIQPTPEFVPDHHPKKGIIVAIILFLCVIAAVVAMYLKNTPEKVIQKSAINTVKLLGEREGVYTKLSSNFVDGFFETQANEFDLSLQFDNVDDSDQLNGIGININSKTDAANKKASTDMAATYQTMEVLKFSFYVTENEWYCKAPTLYDGWFKGNNANILEQFSRSAFNKDGSFEYDPEEDVTIDVFSANKDSIEAFAKQYIYDTNLLFQNISYDKLDEAKADLKGYSATIKAEDIKAYLTNILNALNAEENKAVAQAILKNSELDLEEALIAIENTQFVDTVVKIYVDNNVIVSVDTDLAYIYEGEESKMNVVANYSGDKLEVILNGYDGSVITITDSISAKDNTITQEDIIEINNNGEIAKLSLSSDLTSEGGLKVKGAISAPDNNNLELNIEGSALTGENSLTLNMDTIDLYTNSGDIKLSGQCYTGALKEAITEPDGNVVVIFEESAEKVDSIMNEIQVKLYSIMYALS